MTAVPVFYWQNDDFLVVTSELSSMIEVGKCLGVRFESDLHAMSELFISSYFFTDSRTALHNVKILPRCSMLEISLCDGSAKLSSNSARFSYHNNSWRWYDCVAEFRRKLEIGLKRHYGKKAAIPLSGGADSRAVAACAVAAGLDIDFYTFGQSTVNASDFAVANVVADRFKRKTHCFTANAENFLSRWKEVACQTNWANDSLWWCAKLPSSFFQALQEYDVVLRGDGEGAYGWGGAAAHISDVLHYLEITAPVVIQRFEKYFTDPVSVFEPAKQSRLKLMEKYDSFSGSVLDLKNRLYLEVREWRGIGPCLWPFTRIAAVDAPFLWREPLEVAQRVPKNKRVSKQLILGVLQTFPEIAGIPRSTGPSWNNSLEFYYAGVWEELLDHVGRWSPRPLNMKAIRNDYLKPPPIPSQASFAWHIWSTMKKRLTNKYTRRLAFHYFPRLLGSSMSDRLLIRLALESSLCERLASSNKKNFRIL